MKQKTNATIHQTLKKNALKPLIALAFMCFLSACSHTGTCLDKCWMTFSGRCSACMPQGKDNYSYPQETTLSPAAKAKISDDLQSKSAITPPNFVVPTKSD